MAEKKKVIVVGGGLAGLSATMKLAEQGIYVTIVAKNHVRRAHSCCAQGGINAAVNTKGENDDWSIHAYDTIKGGDFLADQSPVIEMCWNAVDIINMLDRLGVPFNRTREGELDFRRFGGTLYHRTAFAGATTGQQLLYALDEQVRKYESMGLVEKYEHHDFVRGVFNDDDVCSGIVIMDHWTLELRALEADAVVMATGGPGRIYGSTTMSTVCTGSAVGNLYMQGVYLGNPEFIQIHPTAIPGEDKARLMSESCRGEGGRMYVKGDSTITIIGPNGDEIVCGKTGENFYFLEEQYPAFGNLVPRDVASREIYKVYHAGLTKKKRFVYLDVTMLSKEKHEKLAGVLEIYSKFTGMDPTKVPMQVFPAMHYSMGGLWVDYIPIGEDREDRFKLMTNKRGLFAVGECNHQYHGANRLGANSLMSCIYDGLLVGHEIFSYLNTLTHLPSNTKKECFDKEVATELTKREKILSKKSKGENVYELHELLGHVMLDFVSVERDDEKLNKAKSTVHELIERANHITLDDTSSVLNQSAIFAMEFPAMLAYAEAIIEGAIQRKESRGSHYKPKHPEKDDVNFLKTTVVDYDTKKREAVVRYREVDIKFLDVLKRDYTKAKKMDKDSIPWKCPLDDIKSTLPNVTTKCNNKD